MAQTIIEAAAAHYAYGKQVQTRALRDLTRLWVAVDRGNIIESWQAKLTAATLIVAQAQQAVAEDSIEYTTAVMEAQDAPAPQHQVLAAGFAGIAYPLGDQLRRPIGLEDSIASPAYKALRAIGHGYTVDRSMGIGLDNLLLRSQMQIADASRQAEGVAMTTPPVRMHYVRMLNPPSCSRCAILAGRTYRAQEAFRRHLGCDCRHIPVNEALAGEMTTDPYQYFNSLSPEDQDKYFRPADAQAIRDGADIFQVVNAQAETYSTEGGALATYYGTTKRGYWGSSELLEKNKETGQRYRRSKRERLMPEEIYKRSNGNREQSLRMLEDYGYITGLGQNPDGVVRGPGVGYLGGRKPSYSLDPATGSWTAASRNVTD
ncbi:hypothetical protein [Glutamicibacter nicotianae]|uniref:hypothetical protein n=1 Tax=Glutamicibacter nicotianae TaxID=37929 RepID=UPI002553547A|nr:hypothetical protein [Glutamicibacter nicotianae]WIV42578.1 hypothetical protein QQS42_09560 [Glutamicibacter nicotianae]